ncbi:hypothetical protein M422DRAFT_30550 [Sphaerobolus stellatus SS14]|uniref:Uncharacterized protein n=1 Tax=Sphaerobolus stellatus (strain SS14) TaxID=990650 RepID=A0A0C9U7G4_SPHS4|nr:hypothetical protein M422DRAFT_36607 [Sphaerobolus stellatus SS14]KIJ43961.1 hypothetical protein M422DRAFT_30550 [Sphaerobolus stellatus SS14]
MSHRLPTSVSHRAPSRNYNKENMDLAYFTLIQNKMRIANGSIKKTAFKKMIRVFMENEGATVPNWQYEKLLREDSFVEKVSPYALLEFLDLTRFVHGRTSL